MSPASPPPSPTPASELPPAEAFEPTYLPPRHSDGPEEEDELQAAWETVLRGWAIFRRRWPVVAAIVILGSLAVGIRFYTLPPKFETHGLVQIGMYAELLTDSERQGVGRFSPQAANTHLKLLTSDEVVEQALLRLGKTVPKGAGRRQTLDNFLASVEIEPIKDTFLVSVHSKGEDPTEIAARVNALMDAFIPFSSEFFGSRFVVMHQQLSEREEKVRERLRKAEDELQALYRKSGRINFEDQRKALNETHTELQRKLTNLQIDRASVSGEAERLGQALKDSEDSGEALELLIGRLKGDEATQTLTALAEARARVQRTAAILRKDHPEYETVRLQFQAEESALRATLRVRSRSQLAALEQRQAILATQESKMSELLGENKKALQELDKQEGIYSSVSRQVTWYDRELEAIRQQLRRTEGRSEVEMAAQIVNRADVPDRPLPRFTPVILISVVLGWLIVGFVVILIWDNAEDTVSSEDTARRLGLPVLGRVPQASLQEGQELELLQGTFEGSPAAAEAFRLLRTNLTFAAAGLRNAAILVTSGTAADGKSLTSAQLALALAQANGRTLLVEGDMRRPRLQKIMQVAYEQGLSNVLAKEISLEEAVVETDFENLFLLPSGPTPPNPADLLVQGHFEDVLRQATQLFDHVVIDSPPAVGRPPPLGRHPPCSLCPTHCSGRPRLA
ncbi:MAG TPA: hypothetical protein DEA08_36030 [Planctomycetes bacterium]|mgnify:CR=1 FL=1|nr:hypothetical protein [Planctomycetota bacterium]